MSDSRPLRRLDIRSLLADIVTREAILDMAGQFIRNTYHDTPPHTVSKPTTGDDADYPAQFSEDTYRNAARRLKQREGELEIDEFAPVSLDSDDGAYVQAWVWIDDTDVMPSDKPQS